MISRGHLSSAFCEGIPLGPSKRLMEKIEGMAPYEDAEYGGYASARPSYQHLDRSVGEQQGEYSSIQPNVYEGLSKNVNNSAAQYSALEPSVYLKPNKTTGAPPGEYSSLYGTDTYDDGGSVRGGGDMKNTYPLYNEGEAYSNGVYYDDGASNPYSEVPDRRNHSSDDPMKQGSQVSLMSNSSIATNMVADIPKEAPAYFRCPITNEIMQDPVRASDGRTYERASIMRWLSSHTTSPVTGQPMFDQSLDSCVELKRQIREWKNERGKRKNLRPSTPMSDVDC